jgi:hypothetical protein
MIKGHDHSEHIGCPNRGDGVWDRLSTSKLINLDTSITQMNLTAQYNVQIGWVVDGMLYIAQASYRDYVSQEVRPAIHVRESITQLIRCSLDTCVRYTTCLLIFNSQKGSIKALNFLILTS